MTMLKQKVAAAGMAAAVAIGLATAPARAAVAAPVLLNPNFDIADTAANNAYNNGQPFYVQNWSPSGYASNSGSDPGQYDNGYAGGRSVVGFLSGASSSLSQVVSGFTVGMSYRISVGVNARAFVGVRPTFTILADNTQISAPRTLSPVDANGTFSTAFTPIQSDTFIAQNTFVRITFANTSTSAANASTLLTAAAISQVPEPVSLAVLGAGLVGLGMVSRRRV